jgi:hypothetical protein
MTWAGMRASTTSRWNMSPGEDLKNMIRMSHQLGVGTAIIIAEQVCDGLADG